MGVDLRKRERDNRTLGDAEKTQEHELTPQGIRSSPGGCKPLGRMHLEGRGQVTTVVGETLG